LLGAPSAGPETEWEALVERFPSLAALFADAKRVTEFFGGSPLSFRRDLAAGQNWALLPSCAGFVDPLLSTGFALNLLGITRLAEAFRENSIDVERYNNATFAELDAAASLTSALYAKMSSFDEFAGLTLLYFAAMSFTETLWRLGRKERASMFLLRDDPAFASLCESFCERARRGDTISREEVARSIEPWDVAGLSDLTRGNTYPVLLEDLKRARHKIGASEAEIASLLEKISTPGLICGGIP
jgi:FADH2 O2-dependent halogenase